MNTLSYPERDETWSPGDEQPIPRRPRRRLLNRVSATLLAVLTAAAGFYAGVRVEKGQVNGTGSAAGSGLAALRARFAAGAGGAGGGATGGASGTGASGRAGAVAPSGGFSGGAGGGASGLTVGTIQSVSGTTLYVAGPGGNVVKVKLTSSTKVTKSLGVPRNKLHPGDAVVVRGIGGAGSGATLTAATVSDSGAGTTSTSSSGSGGSSGSGSSGVSSLFSSGG